MKRQPQPPSVEAQFIDYLKNDVAFWRSEYTFLKGKVERLELATFKHGNEVAREYAAHTPIIDVPVEQPKEPTRKNWKQVQEEWANMSDAEKEAAIAKGAN